MFSSECFQQCRVRFRSRFRRRVRRHYDVHNSIDADLKRPTNAVAYSEFIAFGIVCRAAVVVIPEGKVGVEIVNQFHAKRALGCGSNPTGVGQSRIDQQLRLSTVAVESKQLILSAQQCFHVLGWSLAATRLEVLVCEHSARQQNETIMIGTQPVSAITYAQRCPEAQLLLRAMQEVSETHDERVAAHEKPVQRLNFY